MYVTKSNGIVILHKSVPGPVLILMELLIGLAPLYLPILGVVKKIRRHNRMKAVITSYESALAESQRVFDETENYLKNNAEVDIPRKFRNEISLDYIIKGLKAREFVSLDQAFFRCEESLGIKEENDFYDL
ncbi:MAG: hypothetical protein K6A45_06860 [Lachnospiraceae bacterium]|nr:hypothetical protein [Lachnospiraceae bacterium]